MGEYARPRGRKALCSQNAHWHRGEDQLVEASLIKLDDYPPGYLSSPHAIEYLIDFFQPASFCGGFDFASGGEGEHFAQILSRPHG